MWAGAASCTVCWAGWAAPVCWAGWMGCTVGRDGLLRLRLGLSQAAGAQNSFECMHQPIGYRALLSALGCASGWDLAASS
jgi:hypothetical protein